jgi:hypothetical protein
MNDPTDAREAGRRLLAGPFLGEFGWELFCWQARLRRISRERGYENAYVYCRPGHESLYEDFAEVNVFPPNPASDRAKDRTYAVIPANQRIVNYRKSWTRHECERSGFFDQEFLRLGKPMSAAPRVVVHARSRTHERQKNWPKEHYEALIQRLQALGHGVAVIGTQADSHSFDIEETLDFRGRSLRDVCDLLAGAKCIIGTSSGPMHLAALCGCPQVVFTDASNAERYRSHWNPFGVEVRFPRGDWQPEVAEVVAETVVLLGP